MKSTIMKKKRRRAGGRVAKPTRRREPPPETSAPPSAPSAAHGAMPPVGSVGWVDLTVSGAEELRHFYQGVVGWTAQTVDMGGYSDYSMTPPDSTKPAAGICHARGENEGLPRCWLVYFVVENVQVAISEVQRRSGRVLRPAGPMGPMGRYAVIEDPSGAACALFEAAR